MKPRGVAEIIRSALPERRGRLALLVLLGVVAATAEGSGLVLLAAIINSLAGSEPLAGARLELAMLLYLAVAAAAAAAVYARTIVTARLRLETADRLRREAFEAILEAGWPMWRRLHGPAATHAIITDAARVGGGVDYLMRAIAIGVRLPVLVIVGLRLSPAMTMGALALGGAAVFLTSRADRRAREAGERTSRVGQALQRSISDAFAHRRVIKVFGLERTRAAALRDLLDSARHAQLAQHRQAADNGALLTFGVPAGAAAALWIGIRVLGLELGSALVLALACARFGQSALTLRAARRQVIASLPADAAVRQLIEEARAAAELDETTVEPPRDRIALRDISLRYEDGTRALSNVSSELPVGKITAIVGPSGAGKSTLVDVILGLLAPTSGVVSLDDRPLDDRTRRAWRTHAAYVPQDGFLFDASIRDNLLAANRDAPDDDLWRALEDASIADRVRALPDRLETPALDGSARLSVGEMQRLALARALLRRPALLVLDEPTSALDAASEARILETVARLKGRHTIVIVAHRPAVAAIADFVVQLEAGRTVPARDGITNV